jgi:hypothetical protein
VIDRRLARQSCVVGIGIGVDRSSDRVAGIDRHGQMPSMIDCIEPFASRAEGFPRALSERWRSDPSATFAAVAIRLTTWLEQWICQTALLLAGSTESPSVRSGPPGGSSSPRLRATDRPTPEMARTSGSNAARIRVVPAFRGSGAWKFGRRTAMPETPLPCRPGQTRSLGRRGSQRRRSSELFPTLGIVARTHHAAAIRCFGRGRSMNTGSCLG